MRVLQVFPEPFEPAPSTYAILYLADGLRQLGHEVQVVAYEGALQSLLGDRGVDFYTLEAKTPFKQWREIQQHAKAWHAEIVHAHSPDAAWACLALGLPTVTSYHDEPVEIYGRSRLTRSLTTLIAPSEHHRFQLLRFQSLRSSQVYVVPECLDFNSYMRWVHKQKSDVSIPRTIDRPTLLYVPYTGRSQEFAQVLEASQRVAQRGQYHHLVVLVTEDAARSAQAQQRLINHDVGFPLIELIPAPEAYPAVLTQVDAVLGMGRTILEALANDRPAICLQAGELGGIVTVGHVYGWEHNRFESDTIRSTEDLAADLSLLLRNHRVLPRYVEQVRSLMAQLADIRHIASRTLRVYRRCMEQQKCGGWFRKWSRRVRLLARSR